MKQMFGTWKSQITPQIVAQGKRFYDLRWQDNGALVWVESRGRQGVIVAQAGEDAAYDLTDSTLSVRGQVGYGGGEFAVHGQTIIFSADGRLWRQDLNTHRAAPITPKFGGYAAPAVSPDGYWVAFVQTYENRDWLALVASDGASLPRQLVTDHDFVLSPVWHPDGQMIAYVGWDHPNMPWDGSRLHLLTLDDEGLVIGRRHLAGDEDCAVVQPEFSPDGRYLSYISDATGIGQLYVYDLTNDTHIVITEGADIDHGFPAWVQGVRVYGWSADSTTLIYRKNQGGLMTLWRFDVQTSTHSQIDGLPFTTYQQIDIAPDGTVAVLASAPQIPPCVVTFHPDTLSSAGYRVRARTFAQMHDRTLFSDGRVVTWQGDHGGDVHGIYYPPHNPAFTGDGAPPLIVNIHGGPTAQDSLRFDAVTQFFTSRGYAVLQVNHRGSTGYGRDYMNALRGQWGVVDVDDSASGAQYLAEQGLADGEKLVIMGGSAGGYTVLQSLVRRPGLYKAGVCLYGISNQFALVEDTHKFEARYNDSLVGVLPDALEIYRERSPLFNADAIRDAVIVFQGEDDPVVPKNQSDMIVDTLRARRVPHEYHLYAGEGHGFRKPETIHHYLEATLAFLKRHVIYA